jgi:hypothetical protein
MRRKIEQKLAEWKKTQEGRKPLLMQGARQVGKTYSLLRFGEDSFDNVVYINFEINLTVAKYFEQNIDPETILRYLETVAEHTIIPEKTLIIFDEIQACERALTSLKYFYEQKPEYYIAASGSLLGVAVNREKYSFPVGKVETVTMVPMDFEEFLWACGEIRLCDEIRRCFIEMDPIAEPLHQMALDYYRQYLIVGGFPACVEDYCGDKRLLRVANLQNEVMNNYIADMAKYADSSEAVKIRACFNSISAQLAKENRKFQYKVVQRGGSSSIFGASIDWLNFAGMVLKCQRVDQDVEPIAVYSDLTSFKLYLCDTGLLVMKSGISYQSVLSDQGNTFMGAVAENYISQALTANGYDLYYWTSSNTAELDFVIQQEGRVIGIEVKSGENIRSRSLTMFISKYKPYKAIRFSAKNFGISNQITCVPLYAAYCV